MKSLLNKLATLTAGSNMRRLTQLHERTRRRIGLSGFVLLCLLPTVGMFTWGVSRHLPIEEAAMENRLGELLGLKVSVESVDHPEPGVVRLRGLVFKLPDRLAEPDDSGVPAEPIARLAVLDVASQALQDPYQKLRNTICMTGTDLEVAQANLPEVMRLFQEAIDYRLNSAKMNVAISLNRLQMSNDLTTPPADSIAMSGDKKEFLFELSNVQLKLLALKDGPQAVVDFRLVNKEDDAASQPIRFRAGQRFDSGHFWFELDTRTEQVPCRFLGMMLPPFNSLGPDAMFCGCFWAERESDGWKGEFPRKPATNPGAVAKLSHIDLDYLINRRFAQTFDGQVDVTIENGTFTSSRIESLRGSLVSVTSGMIGQPLLAAVVKEFGFRLDPIYQSAPVTPYEGFAASFTLDQQGLSIHGNYPSETGERLILVDGRRAILWEGSSAGPRDTSALLRALDPEADAFIPVGCSIQRLAERLPMNK